MNNLQSNERHLADKLRQAPLPDMDRSWEQMRELLDREMPEAAAGGWAGNKRWWWMGITAALIMVAVWITQELNQREQKGIAAKTQSEIKVADGQKEIKDVVKEEKNITTTDAAVNVNKDAETKTGNVAVDKPDASPVSTPAIIPASADKKINTTNSNTKNKSYIAKNNNAPVKQFVSKTDRKTTVTEKYTPASELITSTRQANGVNVNESISHREPVQVANEFETINTSASDAIAVSGKTDKSYLKQLRKKMIKEDNRRMSRSGMRGNSGDDGREITFAAGITVPQSFALGQQQASPYSVSGKSSRFMDYLPAPFFQYHINNKLFLQTEFHFQSPQYTDRLLLARSTTQSSTNVRLEKNVYLEKLYYFNIPLNLYYTPARNFSIGSGLQYSSLLSGVASFEERRVEGQTTSSYQSVTRRFKDDSVAAKFAPSEWRYQFDANYYFKRFTLGLRYNQALKDFVNIQVNPNLPVTQDRNKSFLLYLRFNIWEERKKD
jgi:hypothetical protein